MIWEELASFYAELASETADPFFEELALELMAMGTSEARDCAFENEDAAFEREATTAANKFHECSAPQKGALEAVFPNALRSVNNAAAVLGTAYGRPDKMTPATRALLNEHFHTTDRGNVLTIFRNLFRISRAIQGGLSFECETNCGVRDRCGYAWATQWFGGFGKIHICFDGRPEFCSFTNLNAQEQAALIIHEAAHRHVGIDDKAYVWERKPPDTRDYTKLTPKQAMDNADSYAWFCVELY